MTVFANDQDLLRRFRAGDRKALSTVYWHYVASVEVLLRRCLASTGHQRSDAGACADLADVLQDVFVKAFTQRARLAYDGCREYRPFLMTIARNALIDHLRAGSREIKVDPATIDALVGSQTQLTQESADQHPWADPQTMLLVDHYVAGLPEPERAVYLERYVRCHSQEHTAQALGMTRQQIRTLEGRLRAGLARALVRSPLSVAVSELHSSRVPAAEGVRIAAAGK